MGVGLGNRKFAIGVVSCIGVRIPEILEWFVNSMGDLDRISTDEQSH